MIRRQPWDLFTVFPAHAGVIPNEVIDLPEQNCIPRTRGGDPNIMKYVDEDIQYSPHTRG